MIDEGAKNYRAAQRHGVVRIGRRRRTARKVKWAPEHVAEQCRAFALTHGRTPSECMNKLRRRTLPRAVTDEATNI